jgi:hypothetical protein
LEVTLGDCDIVFRFSLERRLIAGRNLRRYLRSCRPGGLFGRIFGRGVGGRLTNGRSGLGARGRHRKFRGASRRWIGGRRNVLRGRRRGGVRCDRGQRLRIRKRRRRGCRHRRGCFYGFLRATNRRGSETAKTENGYISRCHRGLGYPFCSANG